MHRNDLQLLFNAGLFLCFRATAPAEVTLLLLHPAGITGIKLKVMLDFGTRGFTVSGATICRGRHVMFFHFYCLLVQLFVFFLFYFEKKKQTS